MPFDISRTNAVGAADGLDELPKWVALTTWTTAVGVAGIALLTFVEARSDVERPALLALVMAAVAAPFVLQVWRNVSPPVLLVFVGVPMIVQHLFGGVLGTYEPTGRDQVSLLVVVWLVGQTTSIGRPRHAVVAVTIALSLTIGRTFTDDQYQSQIIWSMAVLVALMCGLFIRTLLTALVSEKLAQAAITEHATTEERQRIAREVHDVIAHSLSVTMLHVTAARLAVGRGDAAAATEALEEAERAGRASMVEIRRTVGLLRTDAAGAAEAPQPSGADVAGLVDGYRAAGVDVAATVTGEPGAVTGPAGLALFRIVQESLSNAAQHAPGAAVDVDIVVGDEVRVTVSTRGGRTSAGHGDGMGLVGMRERAVARGGTFGAGPDDDGWTVRATLPLATVSLEVVP